MKISPACQLRILQQAKKEPNQYAVSGGGVLIRFEVPVSFCVAECYPGVCDLCEGSARKEACHLRIIAGLRIKSGGSGVEIMKNRLSIFWRRADQ